MIVQNLLEARSGESVISSWLSGMDDYLTTNSGENVTQSSAMTLSAWFDSVNILCDDLAKLPRHVFKRSGSDDRQPDYNHPAYWLLAKQPNPHMNPLSLFRLLENKRINWGNAYTYVETDFNGYPTALYPLPPEYVLPYIDDQGELWYVLSVPGIALRKLPSADVIHVKGFSDDGLVGNSYLGYARHALGSGLSEQKFEGNFYAHGLKLGGILETPSKLGPDEKDKVRREFEKTTAGLSNMHKIAVLDLGQKFTALNMPIKDAMFIETKAANIADIARFLKMPLHKLGEGKQSYASNEQANLDYLSTTLDPILVQYEQELDLKLFSGREQKKYYARFNRAALLRTDLAAQRAFLEGMVQNGIYTQNEARAYLELNRYQPGAENPADKLLVSRNYVHLDDLDKTVAAPVAQPGAR